MSERERWIETRRPAEIRWEHFAICARGRVVDFRSLLAALRYPALLFMEQRQAPLGREE